MKWNRKWFLPVLGGIIWATVPVLAAWGFLFGSAELAGGIAGSLGLEESLSQQIVQALAQLKYDSIVPPWFLVLPVGACCGMLFQVLCTTRGRRVAACIIGAVLLLPLTAGALLLTNINGIRLDALINSLLPMLEGLI